MDIKEKVKSVFDARWGMEQIFFREFAESIELDDLNFTHIKSMMMLNFEGKCSMTTVSKRLQLEKGSFTPVAKKLIEYNYVEKEQNDQDKRSYSLKLSQKGKAFVDDFLEKHIEYIASRIDLLSSHEQNEYFSLIDRLNVLNKKIQEASE